MVAVIFNVLTLALVPFLFVGLIGRVKSLWAGRQGPGILQPLFDWHRLVRKGAVFGNETTSVFRLAPSINAAFVFVAAALVPLAGAKALWSFQGDFVVFAYLLAAGRFVTILSALDTGSSFGGMGASRVAAYSGLVQPAFFMTVAGLAALGGVGSFADLPRPAHVEYALSSVVVVLAGLAFFLMILVERVPADDLATHIELTTIQEVMILDNSGPDLALLTYSAWLKMILVGSLLAAVLLPPTIGPALYAAAYLGILVILAVAVGTIESIVARLGLVRVPELLLMINAVALILAAVVQLTAFGAPHAGN